MFREVLAKPLRLPSDNNNIRHVKADGVFSFLQYGLISVLDYQPLINTHHDNGTREDIISTILSHHK